jgi:uncharacterized protein
VKIKISVKNSILYFIGIMFVSMGVALSFRHGFGASSADNLSYILSLVFSISIGTAAFIITTLIILFLLLYFRNWKFLFLFVQVVLFSPLIDFWDLVVFANLHPTGWETVAIYIASLMALPLGCAFLIRSTYPAGVYDELMFFTAHFTKLKLTVSRVLNELLLVILAIIISMATGYGYGSVNIGTLGYVFTVGFFIKFYLYIADYYVNRRKKV